MIVKEGIFTSSVRTNNIISQNGEIKNLITTNMNLQMLNVKNIIVSGNINVNANINVGGNIDVSGNLFVDGIINISNTTTSTSLTSGALIVAGGIGIGKDVNIGGNLNMNGKNISNVASISGYNNKLAIPTGSYLLVQGHASNISTTKSAQGAYIGWNTNNGGGRTDFICNKGGGQGGFNFFIQDSSGSANVSNPLASISGSGLLSIPSITLGNNLTYSSETVDTSGSTLSLNKIVSILDGDITVSMNASTQIGQLKIIVNDSSNTPILTTSMIPSYTQATFSHGGSLTLFSSNNGWIILSTNNVVLS